MQQAWPTQASLSYQEGGIVTVIFEAIPIKGDTCHNAPDPRVGKQHIRAIASDEQRIVPFGTQPYQV